MGGIELSKEIPVFTGLEIYESVGVDDTEDSVSYAQKYIKLEDALKLIELIKKGDRDGLR